MAQKCIDIVPIYQSQPGKFLSQILDLIKYDFVFFSSTIDVFSNKRRREIKQKSGLSWELQKEHFSNKKIKVLNTGALFVHILLSWSDGKGI